VPPAIRSREMVNLESQVEQAGVPVLGRIFQRTAFSSMLSFQTTLDELPPSEVSGLDKAKADAIRLTDAIERFTNPETTSNAEDAA
jgi:chromosome partitioning protein